MKLKRYLCFLLCLIVLTGCFGTAAFAENELSDYNGKRIGVLTGSVQATYTQEFFPNSELYYFSTPGDLTAALLYGTIDAFAEGREALDPLIEEHPEISCLDTPLESQPFGFAFQKNSWGDTLRDQMDAFLKEIKKDGTLDALNQKWVIGTPEDENLDFGQLDRSGRMLVAVTGCDTPPFNYLCNGSPTGMEVELILMFCLEYGYDLKVETLDFGGILPGLVSGKYDIGFDNMTITEERSQSVYFSEPYYTSDVVLAVRADQESGFIEKTFTTLADFNRPDVVLGSVTGTTFDQMALVAAPQAQIKYFNTLPDMIYALSSGQIDGFVNDEPMAQYIASHNEGLACVNEEIGALADTGIVFGDSIRANEMRLEFNEYLEGIKNDGTLDGIFELWYGTDEKKQVADIPAKGKNGTLRLATYAAFPPVSYIKDGAFAGFEIDMLARFCTEYGYALEISDMDFAALIPSVTSGRSDAACSFINITDERKELVSFSDPYKRSACLMVTRGDDAGSGFWSDLAASFERTFIKESRWKLIVEGIWTTVVISVCSALLGTVLGFGLCLLRRRENRLLHGFTTVYIRILQGTPLLVLLMILFYLVFSKSGMSGELVAIIAFALNFAAYVCEIIRSGIEGIDKGQTEAALAIGFTKTQTFLRIILPQAAMRFLPVYKGEFISLVKMTSVVGYIAVQDLTKMSDLIRSRTYEAFFPLISTAIIYFILSGLLTALLRGIEIKLDPKHGSRDVKGVTMQ